AGIVKEYTVGGLALYLEWTQAERLLGPGRPHGVALNAKPGRLEELDDELERTCRDRGLMFQRKAGFRAGIDRVAGGVRILVVALVVLVGVVAGLGVVNTLTANVLDQTRELGILRAVGMKRGQLARLVMAQALILAVVSSIPGVPLALGLSFLMNRST